MSVLELARPEIRDLVPYSSPSPPKGFIRLNANESTVLPYSDIPGDEANRYPEMQPLEIRTVLAELFGVEEEMLCPTRGSSEGIDLLIRTFCRAYTDNILVLPPTFEMYAAYARMHAADVREVPLQVDRDFSVDWSALRDACDDNTKVVFFCSPNNPTGNSMQSQDLLVFAQQMRDKAVVVVDEAYIEFSGSPSLAVSIKDNDNLVVLRTLSKAWALAGARCGAVLGDPALIRMVAAMMSPYAISGAVTQQIRSALSNANRKLAEVQISNTISERDRLCRLLEKSRAITRVWPSRANFILAEATNSRDLSAALAEHRVIVRQFPAGSPLQGLSRITIGTAAENNQLLSAVADCEVTES